MKVSKREYYFCGVKMSESEYKMDSNEVDIDKYIINESNVQRRMAFMMKVGTERLYQKLGGETLEDDKKMYKLILLNLKGLGKKPYLYMRNPSVGVYHLEGVPEGTTTIADALRSRLPERARKLPVDDENGAEWYQQGDTVQWPKNAKSLKSRPKKLT